MQIELNEHTKEILGTMVFRAGPIAHAMRDAGYSKHKDRAEDEQAVVIHWLLNIYLEHGDEWRKKASDQLGEWIDKIKDKDSKEAKK